jgi:hypothetical protein
MGRYFGECETDLELRDCIIYHTKCMEQTDMLEILMTEMENIVSFE